MSPNMTDTIRHHFWTDLGTDSHPRLQAIFIAGQAKETSPAQIPSDLSNNVLNVLKAMSTSKSILGRLSAKAVEIHEATRGDSKNAEVASDVCTLVYTASEMSLPDTTLSKTEQMLEQILKGITIQSYQGQSAPRSAHTFKSGILRLRRRGSFRLDMTLLKGQLHNMLITFQVFEASLKRTRSVEGTVQDLSQRLDVLEGRATSGPSSLSVCPQLGHRFFSDDRDIPSVLAPQTSPQAATPYLTHRNSRNPFLHYVPQHNNPHMNTENAVAGASAISPFAPTFQCNVSFRNSHVGGSSSTFSNVDNSIKENFNNATHYHFHFAPGNRLYPLPSSPDPRY
ncbi:hypothetical protein BDP27DRAFT_1423639 [Rhodocollybia butyracea]|uniref:Uncharacterized protein n=1 Tax=Rhodocollybia butyracea TaxID=206335 RepID=A0A9P5PJE1_9AGAR|nr:hypothetical protein BDP27DRAFT_1423639 [Rhodocollybia butyracea]